MPEFKIGWKDSVGFPSRIHLTKNETVTICGYSFIFNSDFIQAPNKRHGFSNYCHICFMDRKKSIPWHPIIAAAKNP